MGSTCALQMIEGWCFANVLGLSIYLSFVCVSRCFAPPCRLLLLHNGASPLLRCWSGGRRLLCWSQFKSSLQAETAALRLARFIRFNQPEPTRHSAGDPSRQGGRERGAPRRTRASLPFTLCMHTMHRQTIPITYELYAHISIIAHITTKPCVPYSIERFETQRCSKILMVDSI